MSSASERLAGLQSQAKDSEINGYLNPSLLPYWGRADSEFDDKAPAAAVIEGWNEYSSPAVGSLVPHRKLLAEKDETYLSARSGFMKLAPELEAALKKPIFVAPDESFDYDTLLLNHVRVRESAQALIGLGESLAAEEQFERAADLQLAVIQFGRNLMNQTVLVQEMIAVTIQSAGMDGFLSTITPSTRLPSDAWRKVAERLVKAVPPDDQIVSALEGEMLLVKNSLKKLREGKTKAFSKTAVPLPGFVEREERIYYNVMLQCIEGVANGQMTELTEILKKRSTMDWLRGRTGLFVELLVPNFSRAAVHIDFNRDRILGLATAAGILAYREKVGRYPDDLSDLKKENIATVDEESLSRMEFSSDDKGAKLRLVMRESSDIDFSKVGLRQETWFEYKDGTLSFDL